jgi:hypothetical protein
LNYAFFFQTFAAFFSLAIPLSLIAVYKNHIRRKQIAPNCHRNKPYDHQNPLAERFHPPPQHLLARAYRIFFDLHHSGVLFL